MSTSGDIREEAATAARTEGGARAVIVSPHATARLRLRVWVSVTPQVFGVSLASLPFHT